MEVNDAKVSVWLVEQVDGRAAMYFESLARSGPWSAERLEQAADADDRLGTFDGMAGRMVERRYP